MSPPPRTRTLSAATDRQTDRPARVIYSFFKQNTTNKNNQFLSIALARAPSSLTPFSLHKKSTHTPHTHTHTHTLPALASLSKCGWLFPFFRSSLLRPLLPLFLRSLFLSLPSFLSLAPVRLLNSLRILSLSLSLCSLSLLPFSLPFPLSRSVFAISSSSLHFFSTRCR